MVTLKLLRYGRDLGPYVRKFVEYAMEVLGAEVTFYSFEEGGLDFVELGEDEYYSAEAERTCATLTFEPPSVEVNRLEVEGALVQQEEGEGGGGEGALEEIEVVLVDAQSVEYSSWLDFYTSRVGEEGGRVGVIILPDRIPSLEEVHHYKKLLWNLQRGFTLSLSFTRELKETLPGGLLLTLLTLTTPGVVNIDAADMEYFCRGGLTLLPLTAFAEGEGDLPSRIMREVVLGYRGAVDFRSVKGAVVNVYTTEEVPLKDVMRVVEGVRRLLPKSARIITGINLERGERRMGLLLLAGLIPNELLMHLYAT